MPLFFLSDPLLNSERRLQESGRFEEACKALGVRPDEVPVASYLKKFLRGVKRAMLTDTHARMATVNLPQTHSLPNAVLNSAQFVSSR